MDDSTFADPDLTTFCRLDQLGLRVTGQFLEPDRAILECCVVAEDRSCRVCGSCGVPRDTLSRRLSGEPMGWRPTILLVKVRRYRCSGCGKVWRQDLSAAAEPRARLSRAALRWALQALVVQHLTMARIAEALAVAWDTANNAVLAEGRRVLIADPTRFDGVQVIGVDEHVWRHTRRGDKFVTVIIDLTPVRNRTGPSRLLDMVDGRSKKAFKQWLSERDTAWRDNIQIVAMDGFTGFKTAAVEELSSKMAVVMDPFHTVRLCGQALDECRRRVQQDLFGRRGRSGDPLYAARRTLSTGAGLLTDRQRARIEALFADDAHVLVEITWTIYQGVIDAYRDPKPARGKTKMRQLIAGLRTNVPALLVEVRRLGRTLNKRADDILAYFDHPHTSNGATEAINGRLEHLRGSALGFRNLTNYIARSLLEIGGFKNGLHRRLG